MPSFVFFTKIRFSHLVDQESNAVVDVHARPENCQDEICRGVYGENSERFMRARPICTTDIVI